LTGSVNIGFQLIGDLQNFLLPPDNSESAWKPEWVAQHWHPEAARIFAQAPPEEQAGHSQLLIAGVSPDEHLAPEFPRVYLFKLEAPNFQPTCLPKGLTVCHIGSGSDLPIYERTIAELFQMNSPTLQAATAGPAAWAQMLGNSVGRLVSDNPSDGISSHVHIQVARLEAFMSVTITRRAFTQAVSVSSFACPKWHQLMLSLSRFTRTSARRLLAREPSGPLLRSMSRHQRATARLFAPKLLPTF
jgi:hypothetical protein